MRPPAPTVSLRSVSGGTCCPRFIPTKRRVLEADAVADLAGGPHAGLGQKEPSVGTDAHLVHGLSGS